MNSPLRIILIGLVVIAAVAIGYGVFSGAGNQRQRLDQSDFYEAVAEGQVEEVIITADSIGYEIRGKLHSDDSTPDGRSIRTRSTRSKRIWPAWSFPSTDTVPGYSPIDSDGRTIGS